MTLPVHNLWPILPNCYLLIIFPSYSPDNSPDRENCLYFTAVFTNIYTVLETVPIVLYRPCSTTVRMVPCTRTTYAPNVKILNMYLLYDMHLCIENTLFVQMCVFYIIKHNLTRVPVQ
jgi:hypothetical protein